MFITWISTCFLYVFHRVTNTYYMNILHFSWHIPHEFSECSLKVHCPTHRFSECLCMKYSGSCVVKQWTFIVFHWVPNWNTLTESHLLQLNYFSEKPNEDDCIFHYWKCFTHWKIQWVYPMNSAGFPSHDEQYYVMCQEGATLLQ